MSIILRNIRRFQTLKLLKIQSVRYKSYIKYLERINIIENDPIRIYKEMLNRSGDNLSKYISDLDRASYNDIYIGDISQVNKDNNTSTSIESQTNKDRDINQDTSESSNNTDNK